MGQRARPVMVAIVVLLGLGAAGAAHAVYWQLQETKVDPGKAVVLNLVNGNNTETRTAGVGQYTRDCVNKDGAGKLVDDYHFSATFDAPPAVIESGKPFTLSLRISCTGNLGEHDIANGIRYSTRGALNGRPTEASRDGKAVTPGEHEVWAGGRAPGNVRASQGVFEFKVDPVFDNNDITIYAVSTGIGTVTAWEYKRLAPGEKPTVGNGTKPGGDQPDDDPNSPKNRYLEALYRVRILQWQLETLYSLRTSLEDGRLAAIRGMYGIDIVEIGLWAGSVWSGSLANLLGSEAVKLAAKRGVMAKVLVAVMKAVLKDSLKQFLQGADGKSPNVDQLMEKARDGALKEALQSYFKSPSHVADTARALGYRTVREGPVKDAIERYVKNNYNAPIVDAASNILTLIQVADTFKSDIERCDALRAGIRRLDDDRITPTNAKLEQAKQDLEVAKYAYDLWLKDNPGQGVAE